MTTPTLTPKTNQQAFDMGVKHLLSMTHRSTTLGKESGESASCRYLAPDGNRCIVGSMVVDAAVAERMDEEENSGIVDLVADGVVGINEGVEVMLLFDLQLIHDNWRKWGPDGFTDFSSLREVARRYRISSSILDELIGSDTGVWT